MSEPFRAELIVEPFLSGKRIDTFLSRHFRNYSTFRLQRIVRAGEVRINDVPADNDSRVYRGQRVTVRLIEPPDKLLPPSPGLLDIFYEDSWLLVVNKPAGQIAHPAGDYATHSLANAVQHHLDQQTACRGLLRPGMVHRLDRLTSGLLVVSKEHLSHALLTEAFMRRKITKRYLALVEGCMADDAGALDHPIGRSTDPESCLMTSLPGAVDPQSARTEFVVRERFAEHTLVEVRLITGRHHQIRVHFADIGHPVVDDEFYGACGLVKQQPRSRQLAAELKKSVGRGQRPEESDDDDDDVVANYPLQSANSPLVGRHALHAFRLEFRHPITWEQLSFTSPLPADISTALERLRFAESIQRAGTTTLNAEC